MGYYFFTFFPFLFLSCLRKMICQFWITIPAKKKKKIKGTLAIRISYYFFSSRFKHHIRRWTEGPCFSCFAYEWLGNVGGRIFLSSSVCGARSEVRFNEQKAKETARVEGQKSHSYHEESEPKLTPAHLLWQRLAPHVTITKCPSRLRVRKARMNGTVMFSEFRKNFHSLFV